MLFLVSKNKKGNVTWHASILLKRGCPVSAQLKAWAHALLAARVLGPSVTDSNSSTEVVLGVLASTLGDLNSNARFEGYLSELRGVGWNVDIAALETRGGRRVDI